MQFLTNRSKSATSNVEKLSPSIGVSIDLRFGLGHKFKHRVSGIDHIGHRRTLRTHAAPTMDVGACAIDDDAMHKPGNECAAEMKPAGVHAILAPHVVQVEVVTTAPRRPLRGRRQRLR